MTFIEAKIHLKDALRKGGLHNMGWYIDWNGKDSLVTLDGMFSADDLEAIVVFMRHQKTTRSGGVSDIRVSVSYLEMLHNPGDKLRELLEVRFDIAKSQGKGQAA